MPPNSEPYSTIWYCSSSFSYHCSSCGQPRIGTPEGYANSDFFHLTTTGRKGTPELQELVTPGTEGPSSRDVDQGGIAEKAEVGDISHEYNRAAVAGIPGKFQ